MQQAVRIEGVVDAPAPGGVETETDLGPALANGVANLRLLLGRGAVLLRQMLADVLTTGGHLRVEFERLEMQFSGKLVLQPVQRLLQCRQADGAPRTGNVGDEIDLQGTGHGVSLVCCR